VTKQATTRTRSTTIGLLIALVAALCFGASGAFSKPLLDSGWSPAAAVTFRALIGGLLLAPFAAWNLRGKWVSLWRARTRIILMAVIGVAATQFLYFTAIETIPVGTAVLIEYLAPLMLVVYVWVRTRRMPKVVVLIGSAVALVGLLLVVAPDGHAALNPGGLLCAVGASVGCAVYFVVAAKPSDGLPSVAFASAGLVLGGILLGLVSLTGLLPFVVSTHDVTLLGHALPWWVPLLIVGLFATAIAYATSIKSSEILGSRLASFMGLLEVVAAGFYAWILLGQSLTLPQLGGGILILVGIAFVRSEKEADAPIEPGPSMNSGTAATETSASQNSAATGSIK
jgi:drug/metabolite transporter (DMT)-like permease